MIELPYTTRETLLHTDRKGYAVELLVVHETAGTFPGDLNWLIGSGRVSVNWLIDRAGKLYCLDPDFGATAHAGYAVWGTHTNKNAGKGGWGWANLASEGIEMSGPNDGTPFTPEQLATLRAWALWRLAVYKLPVSALVRHLDIAGKTEGKTDPRGVDWPSFLASLVPLAEVPMGLIGGPGDTAYSCDQALKTFYDEHGGLLVFGLAFGNQYTGKDTDGEQCKFMDFENTTIKIKPSMPASWRIRPIQLAEAITRRMQTKV
jgi:hypothetical protein